MGGHIPDHGLGNIEDREELQHQARVISWIHRFQKNGGEEQEEILKGAYKMVMEGTATLSSALDWMVEERFPSLVQKRIQSGDERVNIVSFPETKKPVKQGYIEYLESIYNAWTEEFLLEQKKAKDTEKAKEYIRNKQLNIKDVLSMINHTVYKTKKTPEKKILPEEKDVVLQIIQQTIAPQDTDFPKQIFETLTDQQDKKVIQQYKKFMEELNHDIKEEDEKGRRGNLPDEVLPEHKSRMGERDQE